MAIHVVSWSLPEVPMFVFQRDGASTGMNACTNTASYTSTDGSTATVLSAKIKPFCSKQFLYLTSGENKFGPDDSSDNIADDATSEIQGFMLIND